MTLHIDGEGFSALARAGRWRRFAGGKTAILGGV